MINETNHNISVACKQFFYDTLLKIMNKCCMPVHSKLTLYIMNEENNKII